MHQRVPAPLHDVEASHLLRDSVDAVLSRWIASRAILSLRCGNGSMRSRTCVMPVGSRVKTSLFGHSAASATWNGSIAVVECSADDGGASGGDAVETRVWR
jgi:hypothetical protein